MERFHAGTIDVRNGRSQPAAKLHRTGFKLRTVAGLAPPMSCTGTRNRMTLAMSWEEWAAHDATALAARVRLGELTATELAQQAAAGIEKTNPELCAVVEVFDDVIADPLRDGMNPDGPFRGVPFGLAPPMTYTGTRKRMTLAMSWEEWAAHDATALAARVRLGELSATELAQQAAAAIEKTNPELCAVVEVFDDVIADPLRDGMNPDGPFRGVPFLMKDLGPTMQGRLQEKGSHFLRGHRPSADSYLTRRMRLAGLNLIGRSTTPEFGVCSSAENPTMYVTRNPWNLAYPTCGSSAGAAATVAAGVIPIAHSTDGGGSIRIPAGFNGNIGLKPSRGVFSIAPELSDAVGMVSAQGCQSRKPHGA